MMDSLKWRLMTVSFVILAVLLITYPYALFFVGRSMCKKGRVTSNTFFVGRLMCKKGRVTSSGLVDGQSNAKTTSAPVASYGDPNYVFLAERSNRSVGLVWPRQNVEEFDRIETQLAYVDAYPYPAARMSTNTSTNGIGSDGRRDVKVIMYVGNLWHEWGDGGEPFENCSVSECSLRRNTDDEKGRRLFHGADALFATVFGVDERRRYLPKPPHQIWIVEHWESPHHDGTDARTLRGLVNWTASYRRDSTVPISYGKYRRRRRSLPSPSPTLSRPSLTPNPGTSSFFSASARVDYAAGKKRLAAWIVSNCNARNDRLGYVRRLMRYVDVDVFGGCGGRPLPCKGPTAVRLDSDCFEFLSTDYKFYLAFENSNCKDYITEKLLRNALR